MKQWLINIWAHIIKKFNDSFYPGWGAMKFTRRLNWGHKAKGIKKRAIYKHLTLERK